jgi:hypothetical protein
MAARSIRMSRYGADDESRTPTTPLVGPARIDPRRNGGIGGLETPLPPPPLRTPALLLLAGLRVGGSSLRA